MEFGNLTHDITRLFPVYTCVSGLIGQSRGRSERATGSLNDCSYFQYDVLANGSELRPITRFAIREPLPFGGSAGKTSYPPPRGSRFDRGVFIQHSLHVFQYEP